jgi:hypothetical protein
MRSQLIVLKRHKRLPQAPNRSTVPERLRYLFDLPRCKAWLFRSTRCERQNGGIDCKPVEQNCEENFSIFRCRSFVVPDDCEVWGDGCNYFDRGRCTARACRPYIHRATSAFGGAETTGAMNVVDAPR